MQNKTKYCPIIAKLLKKNNTSSHPRMREMMECVIEFLNVKEKIDIRLVCKMWNEVVMMKLSYLKKENYMNHVLSKYNNLKNLKSVDELGHTIYAKNTNDDYDSQININKDGEISTVGNSNTYLFDDSGHKYSRKKALATLITTKHYGLIKKKVGLGDLYKSKILKQ